MYNRHRMMTLILPAKAKDVQSPSMSSIGHLDYLEQGRHQKSSAKAPLRMPAVLSQNSHLSHVFPF